MKRPILPTNRFPRELNPGPLNQQTENNPLSHRLPRPNFSKIDQQDSMSTKLKAIFCICCARNGAKKQRLLFFRLVTFFIYAFFSLAIFPIFIFRSCILCFIHLKVFVSVFFVPYLLSCVAYHYANIRRLDLHRVNSGRVQLLSARS